MNTSILTLDEFAARMHLSRATVFVWMNKGILAKGKHYLKQGRVLRFLWSDEIVKDIAGGTSSDAPAPSIKAPLHTLQATKASPINWEY